MHLVQGKTIFIIIKIIYIILMDLIILIKIKAEKDYIKHLSQEVAKI